MYVYDRSASNVACNVAPCVPACKVIMYGRVRSASNNIRKVSNVCASLRCNGWRWQLLLMPTKLCVYNYMHNKYDIN